MSDNQKIDPALLNDEYPAGLNQGNSINSGISLRHKPVGIKRINKKGLIVAAGLMGGAAIVAITTFNQAGGESAGVANNIVANQGKIVNRENEFKRDTLWYAQVPDKVQVLEPSESPVTPGALAALTKDGVPDLTGRGVSPLASTTTPRTTVPNLGGQLGEVGGQAQLSPAEQQAQQTALQSAQRKAQEFDQAIKSGLAVQGFGGQVQTAMGGRLGSNGGGNGANQASMPQLQQREDDQNKQERKDAFLKSAKGNVDPDYSSSAKSQPRSPYEVKAGTVIPSIMIGGINSDLPGQVVAQVRENVYDSALGQHLLIPQGSRLVGLYDAHVAYGQKRILLAWSRIIYPNGDSFDLKGMPGADKAGYAGFSDLIDNHYWKVFGSALLMSVISAGMQLSQPNNGGGNSGGNQAPSVSQTVGAALGQQIGQTAMSITQKNINIQPTLEVRPGYQFNVMVTADMILPPSDAQ